MLLRVLHAALDGQQLSAGYFIIILIFIFMSVFEKMVPAFN